MLRRYFKYFIYCCQNYLKTTIYIKDSYFSIFSHIYKHVRSPQVYLLLVFMLKMIFRSIHTSPQDETETDVADINEKMKDRPLDRNKTPLTTEDGKVSLPSS